MKEIKHFYRGYTIVKHVTYSYTKEFVSYSIVDGPECYNIQRPWDTSRLKLWKRSIDEYLDQKGAIK